MDYSALMYKYALKKKDELALNELEEFDTKSSLQSMLIMGGVPFFSVLVSLIFKNNVFGGIAGGFTYMFYIPLFIIFGKKRGKRRERLQATIPDNSPKDSSK